jgi:AcrR family transcriptional regulator
MRISGEERKQQILEVARGLCAEKGFAGTTLDDIADGAGVSRALVVQHFGSKEGVYEALSDVAARAHPLEADDAVQRRIREKDDYGVFHACAAHVFENNLRDAERSNLRLTVFSMLVHLASEVIHRDGKVDKQDFYGVVDTMIELILAGLRA